MLARAPRHSALPSLMPLLLMLAVTGCFYNAYDSKLDEEGRALGERVLAFVDKMVESQGTPEGTFEAQQAFYETTSQELKDLQERSAQMTGGESFAEHFRLISENMELLRKLHSERGEKGLSPTLAGPARETLAVQFDALAKLQQERAKTAAQ